MSCRDLRYEGPKDLASSLLSMSCAGRWTLLLQTPTAVNSPAMDSCITLSVYPLPFPGTLVDRWNRRRTGSAPPLCPSCVQRHLKVSMPSFCLLVNGSPLDARTEPAWSFKLQGLRREQTGVPSLAVR